MVRPIANRRLADSVRGKRLNYAVRPVGLFQASGRKPVIIVYVKTGCNRHRQRFLYLLRSLGIECPQRDPERGTPIPIQEWYGYYAAYEVWGTPEAIATLTGSPCIRDWHPVLDVRVPLHGSGAGEERAEQRSKPPQVTPLDYAACERQAKSLVKAREGTADGLYRTHVVDA